MAGALIAGASATRRFAVTDADTAAALGSGDLPVLATPRLVAWCEATTCAALAGALGPSETSVGTRVRIDHLVASPVGARLEVAATLTAVEGRLLRFEVEAGHHADQQPVGHGEVTRVVVDRERFLSRLS